MSDFLSKNLLDALLLIAFNIDRDIAKRDIDTLIFKGLIIEKHGGGWKTTSLGRELLQRHKIRGFFN